MFVAHGAKVVLGDIDDELGRHVSVSLHPHADFVRCNVAREKDVSEIVDFVVSKYGHLDIMFNNAGIVGRSCPSPAETSMEDFDSVMAVNVRGVMAGVKHASRAMIPQNRGGSILCTGSVSGIGAWRSMPAYTVPKHAVVGIVRSAASDLAPYGIRVNCISPYAVVTPLLMKVVGSGRADVVTRDSVAEQVENLTEFRGATLKAEDVANAALFLSSDDAAYISGLNLVIDGAFTSSRPFHLTKLADQ